MGLGTSAQTSAPVALSDDHQTDGFDSGDTALDEWLRRRARPNQASGATRTFVACTGTNVVAYYALAAAGVTASAALPGRFRRNMPAVIPVTLLARLAVDRTLQGRGIGRALVRDAVLRVDRAAAEIGIRGLLVEAISDEARSFYEALGFTPLAGSPLTLVATLGDLRAAMDP